MNAAVLELEHALRSKKEPLTLQEENILKACKDHAVTNFAVGLGGGVFVTWLGAGAAFGLWRLNSAVESNVQHILSLEGSRIQSELANIMLKKYHHVPLAMRHLSKHFYSEEVYEDSSVDRPIIRWRYRNFSGEPVDHSQITSYGEETHSKINDIKKTAMDPEKNANTAVDATGNPFDHIFGFSESVENVTNPVELVTLSRKQMRKEKRSRRRHKRHQDQSDNLKL